MITVEKLLASSVHLGHSVKEKNPKMSPYIYGERKGIHIIDLLQTLIQTKKVCKFLRSSTRRGKNCEIDLFINIFIIFYLIKIVNLILKKRKIT